MCVSPRICGAGIRVEDRMFPVCTTSLIRKADVNPYRLPARYAAAVASLPDELWNTSAITGSLHLVIIGIDGVRINMQGVSDASFWRPEID